MFCWREKKPQTAGLEPARAEPSGFRVHPLNRLGTSACPWPLSSVAEHRSRKPGVESSILSVAFFLLPVWQTRSRQDSNLRGQSPVDFWSTPLTAWVRLLTRSAKCDEGGVRTHASEEIAALTQRLRPLGHLAPATPCGTRTRNLWI